MVLADFAFDDGWRIFDEVFMQFVGRLLRQIAIEEFDHQKSSFSHLQIQQKRFDV